MGKCLKLAVLFLGCILLLACANKKGTPSTAGRELQLRTASSDTLSAEHIQTGKKLLNHVQTALGTPYVRGGANPGGFDCSGLVSWAFKNIGIEVPRTAREQSLIGQKILNVEDMREGDIVAFRHPKRGYHTGIYVGEGMFIHSPRKRTRVRVNSLSDPYFSSTLLGARRIDLCGNEDNLVAQAKMQLDDLPDFDEPKVSMRGRTVSSNKASDKTSTRTQLKNGKPTQKQSLAAGNKLSKTTKDAKTTKATRQTADKNSRKANAKTLSMAQHRSNKSARAKGNPS